MVSATPEPAENSAGAALVLALWEISARAALRTKPQGAAARDHRFPIAIRSATAPFTLRTDGEADRTTIT